MWQILLITACLAQVFFNSARADCEADIVELRQLMLRKEAQLHERIAVNEAQLQDRIRNEVKLQERITDMEQRLDTEASEQKAAVVPPYIYSAYGCFQDTISLSCPDARTIFVTSAIYGQFLQTCSHEGIPCCPPNPVDDCEESLDANNSQDWLALKLTCDGQTSCAFVNGGGYVPSCANPNVVDYLNVQYQCLPESGILGAIAFTAFANYTNRDYGKHETILFNEILSNFGGGYDPVSSMFTCPVSGIYVISLTVTSPNDGANHIEGEIFKETSFYLSAFGDNKSDSTNSASTTSVLSCEAGERVWFRSDWASSVMQGGNSCCRRSSVSGFLLYAH